MFVCYNRGGKIDVILIPLFKKERVSNHAILHTYGTCTAKEICYGNQTKHKRLVAIETGKLWFEAERRTTNSVTFLFACCVYFTFQALLSFQRAIDQVVLKCYAMEILCLLISI